MLKKLKRNIGNILKSIVWFIAINVFRRNYKLIREKDRLIVSLFWGWNNQSWSAKVEYIKGIVEQTFVNEGTVLECGSGLSTIILGIIGKNRNFKVISLENNSFWANKVRGELRKHNIDNVKIIESKIICYGEFDWYDISKLKNNIFFTLIICDGPPSQIKGGRYGLFPLISNKMNHDCCILLDDVIREKEKEILKAWNKEFDITYKIVGKNDKYALIRKN